MEKVLMKLDYPKETGEYTKPEEYVFPPETAIAANGDVYVADGYGKDFYHAAQFIKENISGIFGGRGAERKFLKNAHGVCIDTRDKEDPVLITLLREAECV